MSCVGCSFCLRITHACICSLDQALLFFVCQGLAVARWSVPALKTTDGTSGGVGQSHGRLGQSRRQSSGGRQQGGGLSLRLGHSRLLQLPQLLQPLQLGGHGNSRLLQLGGHGGRRPRTKKRRIGNAPNATKGGCEGSRPGLRRRIQRRSWFRGLPLECAVAGT